MFSKVKAWTIQKGSTAPQVKSRLAFFCSALILIWSQAAGRIHTDFEKGFIMAEVMKFAAFKVGGQNMLCAALSLETEIVSDSDA